MQISLRAQQTAPLTRELTTVESPDLIYFSSVSENTKRFVDRLDRPAARIPLRPRKDGLIRVAHPFVLVVPTYGGGAQSGTVPKQVISFLNDPANRSLIRGVITAGNTNFGEHYCLAGPIISAKCRVPELYRFELLGTQRDIDQVTDGLARFWAQTVPPTRSLPHSRTSAASIHPIPAKADFRQEGKLAPASWALSHRIRST